jgi:hypothetical protein
MRLAVDEFCGVGLAIVESRDLTQDARGGSDQR